MKIRKICIVYCLFLTVLLLNFGCATTEKIQKGPPLLEKPEEKVVQRPAPKVEELSVVKAKESPPSSEIPKAPSLEKTVSEKKLPAKRALDPKSVTLAEGPVQINVEKMPLPDFIIYALGETLKVSFVMDQKLMESKESVNLRMTQPMPPDKALEILLGLFERYNLYVEEKAGALYILHKPPEPKQPFDIRVGREIPESPEQVLQVVPLRYIKPSEIEALLREMYKTNIQIRPYPRENVLLLYGQASQVRQIIEFIGTFDVPYLQERKISLLKLTYWQIDDFIKQISQIFEGMGFSIAKSPKDPGILLIPIKPLGSILVVAPDEKSLSYLLHWKERLDTPEAAGAEERPFVYTPKYTKASDLVKSIKNLYGIMPTPADTPTPATPTRTPIPPTTAPATARAAPTALKISSDDYKNLIMVVTSPSEYKNILSLLMELDVPPRQVLIEATVAELTLRDELKYGLEWFFRNKMSEGAYTLQTLFSVPTGGPGLVYKFISDSGKFNVVINAFALDDKVNILSTPRLMVLDNQEATIQVGTDIPIITSEVTAEDIIQAQPSILRNIQYRNTGIILRVKPTINTEGLLTLNISQEVSEIGSNPPGIDSPTILMRRINTTVVASQGETIVLGGLIAESKGFTVNKIPLLGDIPILGVLFKTTSKNDKKTELIIFLKPTIITNIDQAAKITQDLKRELKWLK
jgi:general secretion pathway protein D